MTRWRRRGSGRQGFEVVTVRITGRVWAERMDEVREIVGNRELIRNIPVAYVEYVDRAGADMAVVALNNLEGVRAQVVGAVEARGDMEHA